MNKKTLSEQLTETSIQTGEFIENFYRKDSTAPYLTKFALGFIKKCRYRNDDIRPLLTKLGYELNNGKDNKYILPAMASMHLFLLGFMPVDDIIDGASKQNFQNPQIFAEKLALAYSLSTKLKEDARIILRGYYGDLPNYLEIDRLVSISSEKLDGSHTLEVLIHSKKSLSDYSLKDYIKLIDEATSILISTPFVIGGLITGVNKKTEKTMFNYGTELGRLVQIRDDFLDYINPKITGKLAFADLSEKRKRFPLFIIYKNSGSNERQKIDEILKKENISKKDICDVIRMILSENIREKSEEIVNKIYDDAIKNLEQLPKVQPSYNSLEEITKLFGLKS